MILYNGAKRGRRWQVILGLPRVSVEWDISPREWADGVRRRGRGVWPTRGPWPIFHYLLIGPFEVRRMTREAQRRR